ncbi:hypothetical protein HN51_018111 [Arachis hypogaea]
MVVYGGPCCAKDEEGNETIKVRVKVQFSSASRRDRRKRRGASHPSEWLHVSHASCTSKPRVRFQYAPFYRPSSSAFYFIRLIDLSHQTKARFYGSNLHRPIFVNLNLAFNLTIRFESIPTFDLWHL